MHISGQKNIMSTSAQASHGRKISSRSGGHDVPSESGSSLRLPIPSRHEAASASSPREGYPREERAQNVKRDADLGGASANRSGVSQQPQPGEAKLPFLNMAGKLVWITMPVRSEERSRRISSRGSSVGKNMVGGGTRRIGGGYNSCFSRWRVEVSWISLFEHDFRDSR